MPARSLTPLFSPRSLAIVGASDNPRKWGNWLSRGALRGESRRDVYLVNRRGGEILGRRSYPSLRDLPDSPELVVLTVPDSALEPAVDEALAVGAKAIIAISATDNETQGAAEREARLAQRIRAAGAVLLGPNCLGVLDLAEELELTSNPLPAGTIGLISQSGNLALELGLLAAAEGLGFSRFASLGNQADLDCTALVEDLAGHPGTELIALYVEDFRDGRAFARAAADAVASGTPVLVLAMASGEATTRAVRSHTGALSSDGATIDAACRAAGIERVQTPRELIDTAQALLRAGSARGRRIGVLSDGGGHGAIAAAICGQAGLDVPELSPRTSAALRTLLPDRAAAANPIDLAGAAEGDVHAFDRVASVLLASGELDAVLLTGYFGGYGEYGEELAREEIEAAGRLGAAAATARRPVVAHTMYPSSLAAAALRDAGVPVYTAVEHGVAALTRLADRGMRAPVGVPVVPRPAEKLTAADGAAGVASDGYELARGLLGAAVRFLPQRTVRSWAQARVAAAEFGYPVVLKALGLLHKSDAGAVVLDLSDEEDLRRAYDELERRLAPAACSVEPMAALGDGIELLIGARWDARFGPVVLVGAGGVYTEILRDTVLALAPIDATEAEELIRSLRCAALMLGARGRPVLEIAAAARALSALSELAAAHPEIAEMEINPLLVMRDGAVALDARIVRV